MCSSRGKQALVLPCSGAQGSILGSSDEYLLILVLYCAAAACPVSWFGHYSFLRVLLSLEYL